MTHSSYRHTTHTPANETQTGISQFTFKHSKYTSANWAQCCILQASTQKQRISDFHTGSISPAPTSQPWCLSQCVKEKILSTICFNCMRSKYLEITTDFLIMKIICNTSHRSKSPDCYPLSWIRLIDRKASKSETQQWQNYKWDDAWLNSAMENTGHQKQLVLEAQYGKNQY